MNQKTLEQDFEMLELNDNIDTYDTYREDYAQQLLEDDALELEEVAFLKGYRDYQF